MDESNHVEITPKPTGTSSFGSTLFCLVGLCIIDFFLVPYRYWVKWDMLMFAIDVREKMAGDGFFSYPHNLIKSLIFHVYKFFIAINSNFEMIDAIRIITLFFLIVSTLFIFFSIRRLTKCNIFSFAGALFWLILPGIVFLVHEYEDNIWASSFLCVFLFAVISIHKSAEKKGGIYFFWVLVAATSLATGINIHQQLCLLFYLFFVLIFTHYRLRRSKKILGSVLFCLWYLALSVIQNQLAFGQPHLAESIRRLYSNPYVSGYPKLWFFTSGLSISDWANLILTGWKSTLLFDGVTIPLIYYFLALLVVIGSVILILKRKLWYKPESSGGYLLKQQLWLSSTFLIFIPYSLLYEPQNLERWDSVLPGLTIFVFSTLYYLLIPVAERYGNASVFSSKLIRMYLVLFMAVSCLQTYAIISIKRKIIASYPVTVYYSQILSYLKDRKFIDSSILLLDEGFRVWDTDSRILLDYPALRFITLQRGTLQPLQSSYQLQHTKDVPDQPITKTTFPNNSRFIVMPDIYNEIISADPGFFAHYHVAILKFH